ncbi:MAG: site-2 protease family protein [bacterium]
MQYQTSASGSGLPPYPRIKEPSLFPYSAGKRRQVPWTNLVLFFITLCTTVFAGTYLAHFDPDIYRFWIMLKYRPEFLVDGLPFAGTLMAILISHELGHYIFSRYHKVDSSLPYFIPGPNLVGTFGAVIVMKSRIPHRRALFDIGAAGPLMGLLVAVFATVLGLVFGERECMYITEGHQNMVVLFQPNLLMKMVFPVWESFAGAEGCTNAIPVINSPLLDAACIGYLVTTLNLLPVGQLDGGHISYSVLGRRSTWVGVAALAGMVFLGIFFWPPWLFMGVLLFFLMGRRGFQHPPPVYPEVRLTPGRKLLAALVVIIFILIIAPEPLVLAGI